ncbi:uncharacterized protein LOC124440442 [Xenia sp. Carnegie-2017]|uniref:uncharacterized protein LOC124440442 n=1 Tax=Xenia sp. Carnegie-2017 TaxID=2897299 RepID=UPI001F0442E8|nr:uncharacterized protein LOC124440442 [Xenia sp. Carnegie-2017]
MMMKMQLKEQQEIADRELEDALNQQYMAQQDESSSAERKHLVSQIDELEAKLEDMDSALKQYEEENKQMTREVRSLSDKLNQEQAITDRLKQEVIDAKAECEREKGINKTDGCYLTEANGRTYDEADFEISSTRAGK